MANLYFISSPLHLIVASNLVLHRQEKDAIAVLISKQASLAEKLQAALLNSEAHIFHQTKMLVEGSSGSRVARRRALRGDIENLVLASKPELIATGNDRRFEFQYAMKVGRDVRADVQGVYFDDGAVSYLGHKSKSNFAHNYLDPLLKKLVYGWWWKSAVTTGATAWVSEAYLAFPELANELLKNKHLHALDSGLFASEAIKQLASAAIDHADDVQQTLAIAKYVVCLPADSVLKSSLSRFIDKVAGLVEEVGPEAVCVKAHPRSDIFEQEQAKFSGARVIDQSLGFEFILPLIAEGTCIIGDVSTALLTAKWLRPELQVEAIAGEDDAAVKNLFTRLGVQFDSIQQ